MGKYSSAEQKRAWQRAARARNRALLNAMKDMPCDDCDVKYPSYVMDFDHRGDKRFTLSKVQGRSARTLIVEAAKCDVVCANCHRERTHLRGQDAE